MRVTLFCETSIRETVSIPAASVTSRSIHRHCGTTSNVHLRIENLGSNLDRLLSHCNPIYRRATRAGPRSRSRRTPCCRSAVRRTRSSSSSNPRRSRRCHRAYLCRTTFTDFQFGVSNSEALTDLSWKLPSFQSIHVLSSHFVSEPIAHAGAKEKSSGRPGKTHSVRSPRDMKQDSTP